MFSRIFRWTQVGRSLGSRARSVRVTLCHARLLTPRGRGFTGEMQAHLLIRSSALCRQSAALTRDDSQSRELDRLDCVTLVDSRLLVSVAQLDLTVRKLLLQLCSPSAFSQTHNIRLLRFSLTFDDVTFARRAIGEFALHETLPSFAPTADPSKQAVQNDAPMVKG